MSEEIVLSVLDEVLEELQTANKSLKEMGQKMVELEARVKDFEQKEIKVDPPNLEPLKEKIDELPVVMGRKMTDIDDNMNKLLVAQHTELRQETATGLAKIAVAVEAQPKPIVRRISLFPENDYQGNYKTFIRWLIGGIVGAMLVASAYVLGNEWVERVQRQPPPGAGTEMKLSVDTASAAKPAAIPVRKFLKHARVLRAYPRQVQ